MAIFQVGDSFTATPVWMKADQTPGKIQGVPTWENPTPTIYDMVVADDSLSATGTVLLSGAGQIVARADADLGDGVREVIALGDIEVPEAEVTVARMDLVKN